MVTTLQEFKGKRLAHSFVDLGDSTRAAFVATPQAEGSLKQQLQEVLSSLKRALESHRQPLVVTSQTVFLRDIHDEAECRRAFSEFYGAGLPVTYFVHQPPCCGANLALEAWAIGGVDVRVERHGPCALSVAYDSVRWIYCGGIQSRPGTSGTYEKTMDALGHLKTCLASAKAELADVVRTWFYLGGITSPEDHTDRYKELNRARADFYRRVQFGRDLAHLPERRHIYPASTGIGMIGEGLVLGCVALQTSRNDVQLRALENPNQIPAYSYHPRYSPKSPKFSRAMALVLGNEVTTWISGTASIVDSESCHLDSIEKQTEQSINNIEALISGDNFRRHNLPGPGLSLADLAKVRVYIKRPEHIAACQAVCRNRFGNVPAIYALADICRPELLVEIEGVAFSRRAPESLHPCAAR